MTFCSELVKGAWLSRKITKVSFIGLDVSETQLSFAQKNSKKLENYSTSLGDFHDLRSFESEIFDVVFIIEALCHSGNTEKVLKEVNRVLKKGGVFIVYDGYRSKSDTKITKDESLASKLLEVGVAVQHFQNYKDFINLAENNGLHIESEEDLSDFVIPTMEKFEKQTKRFLRLGFIAKILLKLLPHKFTYNLLSGYLFPILMKMKVFSYRYTLFSKR